MRRNLLGIYLLSHENEILKQIQLVTAKPFFFIANLHEDEGKNTHYSA